MVVPVLRQLAEAGDLTVYTQDDPDFPDDPRAVLDDDLAISWHHAIETVPTLLRVATASRSSAPSDGCARTGSSSPGIAISARTCRSSARDAGR